MAQDIMTSAEAAQYLRVGLDTLKRRTRMGQIPGAKIGRQWRFRKVDLDAWLSAGGTRPEPAVDAWLVAQSDKVLRGPRLSNEEVKAALGL